MKQVSVYTGFTLAMDIALLAVCILHIPHLTNRPCPPFDLEESNGNVIIHKINDHAACPDLRELDTLVAWKGQSLNSKHGVEFLADFCSIGDTIQTTLERSDNTQVMYIRLIAAYDLMYVIMILFVGLVAWGVGVFVLIRQQGGLAAPVLHWALVLLGVTVMITWGQTLPDSMWMYLSRGLFIVVYAGVPATFLHFTILFPRPPTRRMFLRGVLSYVPISLLGCGMIVFQSRALREQSLEQFNNFQALFDVFHIALVVYVGIGMLHFVRSYFRSASSEEQKKLKWILWGLTVGPLPFLLLTIIPQYYFPYGFVPEKYTLIFLAIIPIAFGISFIKYHLLDIDVVVNRTTVYGIVLTAVIVAYTLLVGIVATVVGTYTVGTSAVATVFVAFMFEPVRRRVQHFVDKQFFRVRYDFRKALHRFTDDMKMCADAKQLADLLIARSEEVIPVERIGVVLLRQPNKRLYFLSHRGFDVLEQRSVRFEAEKLNTQLQLPVAIDANVEQGIRHESADERMFSRWGISLVFPMKSTAGEFIGFFVLGAKKSDQRFNLEDVDLLGTVAMQAGIEFERIALQQKLALEQAENRRLEEVNRMKSDFVANVSHELRTPLTSIKLYAEMLHASSHSNKKHTAYLHTIIGEADRLDRMVTTVLDSSRIDRGAKEFHRCDTDLRSCVNRVLVLMKYQLDKNGFRVLYNEPTRAMPVWGDPDAFVEAIMNLIENVIKYSVNKKYLKISLIRKGTCVLCSVMDKGRGISTAALPHIFERFYRDPASNSDVQGVGLGLSLVKYIVEENGGKVEVLSSLGKGSTFSLWFPLYQTQSASIAPTRQRPPLKAKPTKSKQQKQPS